MSHRSGFVSHRSHLKLKAPEMNFQPETMNLYISELHPVASSYPYGIPCLEPLAVILQATLKAQTQVLFAEVVNHFFPRPGLRRSQGLEVMVFRALV